MRTMAPKWITFTCTLLLISASVLLLHNPVSAQTDSGRITGTVTDSNGGLVPGAAIVVKNERTGDERAATTNDVGYFVISGLRPSSYSVIATAKDLGKEH